MKARTTGKDDTPMAAQSAGSGQFTINDLAKRLYVSAKTLKKWEREKKIPEARRNPFGWRLYTEHEMTTRDDKD